MGRTNDWDHPLPFGDSLWVKKSEVEPLTIAVRRLLDNLYEFGEPTDEVIVEQVETALQALLASCVNGHQGPLIRNPGGSVYCVTCRSFVSSDQESQSGD